MNPIQQNNSWLGGHLFPETWGGGWDKQRAGYLKRRGEKRHQDILLTSYQKRQIILLPYRKMKEKEKRKKKKEKKKQKYLLIGPWNSSPDTIHVKGDYKN